MTTSTLGRPPSWSSLARALRTFTLVLGLSGPVSPPPWPSCLPSSCTRSSKPGIVRIQLSLEFSIVFRYSLTITLWSRTHQHGILSANTTSRMESSANGKRLFVVGLRIDLYTFYTLGINSIFGIIIFRVDILWHSRGCFDGHPLDLLHLFLDIGLLELLILTINKNIDNWQLRGGPMKKCPIYFSWIALARGPKSLNFPDGNFQRAKTFRTKCVNRFHDKKSA